MKLCIQTVLLIVSLTLAGCNREGKKKPDTLPRASAKTEAIIAKAFPGAMTGPEFSDSLLHYISVKYGIETNKMLLGASTCVDDIIYTKYFHYHPEIKASFHYLEYGGQRLQDLMCP